MSKSLTNYVIPKTVKCDLRMNALVAFGPEYESVEYGLNF
jgi:hypothetical protein